MKNKKDGVTRKYHKHKRLEHADPEKAEKLKEMLTEPFPKTHTEIGKILGMNQQSVSLVAHRMNLEIPDVMTTLRSVKTSDFKALLDDRAFSALEHMTVENFKTAPLRDKVIAVGILLEKRQLLRGEPTQIFTMEERKQVSELIPYLIKEAERRGMTIDLTPADYSEVGESPKPRLLEGEIQEERVNKTVSSMRKQKRRL